MVNLDNLHISLPLPMWSIRTHTQHYTWNYMNIDIYISSSHLIIETITVTWWWARLCLKSPASRLFTQSFVQAHIKENIRFTALCEGYSRVAGELPTQRASNAENVSISWRHQGHATRQKTISSNRVAWIILAGIMSQAHVWSYRAHIKGSGIAEPCCRTHQWYDFYTLRLETPNIVSGVIYCYHHGYNRGHSFHIC